MIFKHEDLAIDLTNSNKGKLYKGRQLIFLGDGYKAITMMMRNAKECKLTMKAKDKEKNK